MKKIVAIVSLLIFSTTAYAISDLYVSGTWRYRITVEVETPEGLKTGSAVREISNSASSVKILDFPEQGNPAKEHGEAVVVDLGERGVFFALISDRSDHELYEAFPTRGETTVEGIKHFNRLKPGMKAELKNKRYWPKMVTFTDMDDPKTVQVAYYARPTGPLLSDPLDIEDNMPALFGEGVALKKITIEITDKPVTKGMAEKYIPSFEEETGFWEWRRTLKFDDPRKISGSNFRRGAI